MYSLHDTCLCKWVAPFGNLYLNAFYRLDTAYRRLTRPSSPLTAKASTVYAWSLNHTTRMSFLFQSYTVTSWFTLIVSFETALVQEYFKTPD